MSMEDLSVDFSASKQMYRHSVGLRHRHWVQETRFWGRSRSREKEGGKEEGLGCGPVDTVLVQHHRVLSLVLTPREANLHSEYLGGRS